MEIKLDNNYFWYAPKGAMTLWGTYRATGCKRYNGKNHGNYKSNVQINYIQN